ncbi:hypothetical protein [Dechloromonas denitrificans]|nr:hypothetical protein [Dechloromonas denitrificans]
MLFSLSIHPAHLIRTVLPPGKRQDLRRLISLGVTRRQCGAHVAAAEH